MGTYQCRLDAERVRLLWSDSTLEEQKAFQSYSVSSHVGAVDLKAEVAQARVIVWTAA